MNEGFVCCFKLTDFIKRVYTKFVIGRANMYKDYLMFTNNIQSILRQQAQGAALKVLLAVHAPTQDLITPQQLDTIIHPSATYQVIPSSPLTLAANTQELLETVLKASAGKMIDVALPYQKASLGKFPQYYFGRYIFVNGRLRGVRLASSDDKKYTNYPCSNLMKWPKKLVQWVPAPVQINRLSLSFGAIKNEKIPIGDFILGLENAKIGLLFQSEVNEFPTIFQEYARLGVTIFSVLDDTPSFIIENGGVISGSNFKSISPSTSLLKNSIPQNSIAMFTGMRYATLDQTYLTMPCICSKGKLESGVGSLCNNSSLSVVCQLVSREKRRQFKNLIDFEDTIIIEIDEQLRPSDKEYTSEVTKKLVGPCLGQIERVPKRYGDLTPMLRLLYLFKHINKRSLFTIPLKIDRKYILQLAKLASYLLIPTSQLIQVYKTDPNQYNDITQIFKEVKVYDSLEQIAAQEAGKVVYVYPDRKEDLAQLEKIACIHKNVYVCSDLITRVFQTNPKQTNRIDQLNKINLFLAQIAVERIYDLKQILRIARCSKYKLNPSQQIEAISIMLKEKLRQCYTLNPLTRYFLDTDPKVIQKDLIEAELSLAGNDEGISDHVQNEHSQLRKRKELNQRQNEEEKSQKEKPKNDLSKKISKEPKGIKPFSRKMDEIKRIKKRLNSKPQSKCHHCSNYFEIGHLHKCHSCRTEVCFACIEEVSKIVGEKQREYYEQCIVCLKLCQCFRCKTTIQSQFKWLFESIIKQKDNQMVSQQKQSRDCQNCEILGRKPLQIVICCERCSASGCYLCAKDSSKLSEGYSWLCQDCSPSQEYRMIDESCMFKQPQNVAVLPKSKQKDQKNIIPQLKKQPGSQRKNNNYQCEQGNNGPISREQNHAILTQQKQQRVTYNGTGPLWAINKESNSKIIRGPTHFAGPQPQQFYLHKNSNPFVKKPKIPSPPKQGGGTAQRMSTPVKDNSIPKEQLRIKQKKKPRRSQSSSRSGRSSGNYSSSSSSGRSSSGSSNGRSSSRSSRKRSSRRRISYRRRQSSNRHRPSGGSSPKYKRRSSRRRSNSSSSERRSPTYHPRSSRRRASSKSSSSRRRKSRKDDRHKYRYHQTILVRRQRSNSSTPPQYSKKSPPSPEKFAKDHSKGNNREQCNISGSKITPMAKEPQPKQERHPPTVLKKDPRKRPVEQQTTKPTQQPTPQTSQKNNSLILGMVEQYQYDEDILY